MADVDDFDAVRADTDPLRRARRATTLQTHYQQRATELARLRKAAIEEAHREQNLSYTEIAAALGITKGRITQIRSTAPGPERAFFGVGPVSVGVPLRHGTDYRMRTYIDASDALAQQQAESMLASLSLESERFNIEPDREEPPEGDSIVVIDRWKSVIARLLAAEPADAVVGALCFPLRLFAGAGIRLLGGGAGRLHRVRGSIMGPGQHRLSAVRPGGRPHGRNGHRGDLSMAPLRHRLSAPGLL
jgi:hypothetical protein